MGAVAFDAMLVKASLRVLTVVLITACSSLQAAAPQAIGVIHLANGTLFPPDLAPPTFVWKDSSPDTKYWRLALRASISHTWSRRSTEELTRSALRDREELVPVHQEELPVCGHG